MKLSLTTCLVLKKLGFPQDRWPQLVYAAEHRYASDYNELEAWAEPEWQVSYVACPGAWEALDWIEQNLDVHWSRGIGGTYYAWRDPMEKDRPNAKTPEGLIILIDQFLGDTHSMREEGVD